MSLVPEQAVFGPRARSAGTSRPIGWIMLAGLVGFYLVFFTFLYRRARVLSHRIAEPLTQIERMAHRIAVGEYEQAIPEFGVTEFRHTRGRAAAAGPLARRFQPCPRGSRIAPDRAQRGTVDDPQPLAGWPRLVRRRRLGDRDQSDLPHADRLVARGAHRPVAQRVLVEARRTRIRRENRSRALRRSSASLRPRPAVLECRVVGAGGGAQVAYFPRHHGSP